MSHKHLFRRISKTVFDGIIFECVCGKKKVYSKGQTPSSDCVD